MTKSKLTHADKDTINTCKGGIARENNAAFWTFVEALLAYPPI